MSEEQGGRSRGKMRHRGSGGGDRVQRLVDVIEEAAAVDGNASEKRMQASKPRTSPRAELRCDDDRGFYQCTITKVQNDLCIIWNFEKFSNTLFEIYFALYTTSVSLPSNSNRWGYEPE
jgi:hypothetical protein